MNRRDTGAVLVLTLILTVVLGAVVIALAGFATVGLRTSHITDSRSETNADGAAAITWAMEAFRDTSLSLTDCGQGSASALIVPSAIAVNGSTITLTCEVTAPDGAFPVVHLRATAQNDGSQRNVEAVAQFAPGVAVRALDWKIDDSDLIIP
jgi:hypothetical protein